MVTTAVRGDNNSSSKTHSPIPSLPVYSVDRTTRYYNGSRHDQGRVVWEVLVTDPNTPDQLPQPVAECASIHSAKMLAAMLNSYETSQYHITGLEQTITTLENEIADLHRANIRANTSSHKAYAKSHKSAKTKGVKHD